MAMRVNGKDPEKRTCDGCEFAPLCDAEGFSPWAVEDGGVIVCIVVQDRRRDTTLLVPHGLQVGPKGNVVGSTVRFRRFRKSFFRRLLGRFLG